MPSQEFIPEVAITIIVLNAISAIALIFIIAVYISGIKIVSHFSMRMVFYLCVACLLQNLYVFVMNPFAVHQEEFSGQATSRLCNFEGVFKTMSDLSSVIWTTLILFSPYYCLKWNKSDENIKRLEVWFLLLGFVLPLVVGCLPLAFQLYGYYGYYCWFSTGIEEEFWLSMGFYYIPLWIMFGFNIYMTNVTFNKLKELDLDNHQKAVFKRLLWYPAILFVTAFFSTLHKIEEVVTDNKPWPWLIVLDYVLFSLYGLFNAIAYGLNPNIRTIIKEKMCKSEQERADSGITKQFFLKEFN